MVDIFSSYHTSCLIELSYAALHLFYLFYGHHIIITLSFLLPLTQQFHYVAPSFHCFGLSCNAKTNGFAGALRGCQLLLPEVICARRDQQPLPLPQHPVLQAFPLKEEEFFFFPLRNQMLAMSHTTARLLVIIAHWLQIKDQDVYNVSDWVYSFFFFFFGLGRWKQSCLESKWRPQSFSKSSVLHFVKKKWECKSAGKTRLVVLSKWMQTSDILQCVNTSEGQRRAAKTVLHNQSQIWRLPVHLSLWKWTRVDVNKPNAKSK